MASIPTKTLNKNWFDSIIVAFALIALCMFLLFLVILGAKALWWAITGAWP